MRWLFAAAFLIVVTANLLANSEPREQASRVGHPNPATNLAMGQWRFVRIGDADVIAVGRQQPYLKFDERKGSVTGFTGCNRLTGKYRADEAALVFQDVVSTRMACPKESHEQQVLQVLSSTTGYKLVEHELHLLGSDGVLAILIRPHQEQTTQPKRSEN